MNSISNQTYINIWLYTTIVMGVLMILIGGITRLTDSGLSMVEWRPIWGFLPPITDEEWNRVFSLYMSSPESIFKNQGLSIIEFKKIFFWEYFHRLWGRLIGIVFIIPLIIFYLFNKIPNSILLRLITILLFSERLIVVSLIKYESIINLNLTLSLFSVS